MILVAGKTLGTTLSRTFPWELSTVRDAIDTGEMPYQPAEEYLNMQNHLQRLWSRRTSAPPSSGRLLTFPMSKSNTMVQLAETLGICSSQVSYKESIHLCIMLRKTRERILGGL